MSDETSDQDTALAALAALCETSEAEAADRLERLRVLAGGEGLVVPAEHREIATVRTEQIRAVLERFVTPPPPKEG